MDAHNLAGGLGIVGMIIVVSALLSGLVQRSRMPQVAVALGLGALLSPWLEIGLESPIFRVVATLSLAFVLFTDAVTLNLREVRQHWRLATVVLGPGTLLTAFLVGLAAHYLLDLSWPMAIILGAAVASTDPVLLRGILSRPDLPVSARHALRLESGLNDIVLLPIVLVAASGGSLALLVKLFLLGPLAGVLVGLVSVVALEQVRKRLGMRRDYESIYSIGVALSAFAAAELLGGSGFLAAFAAGLTIAAMDVDLCDCFVEYGENTTEVALLFCFVLLGAGLIWAGLGVMSAPVMGFVAVALFGRTIVLLVSLWKLPRREKWLVAWFGPRGLSTLLLVLVPVFAGTPGSVQLFPIACLVALASLVVHGGSVAVLPEGERVSDRISVDELTPEAVLLDARSEASYAESSHRIAGSIRIDPARPVESVVARDLPPDAFLIAFCA